MSTPSFDHVAKALVLNEKHEVLILTGSEYEGRPDRSFKPELPGGMVDPGETELGAVIREIHEEAGIVVEADAPLLVYAKTEFYEPKRVSVTRTLFVVRLRATPDVTLSWEHAAYAWVPLGRLPDVEMRPFYAEAIRYCLDHDILE